MNKVLLSGRLTKDFELKSTNSGTKYAQNSIAVGRDFKDKDGGFQTDFFNFTLWGNVAEKYAIPFLKKGDMVEIEATLQNNNREVDGKTVYQNELQQVKIKKVFIGSGDNSNSNDTSFVDSKGIVSEEDLAF